MMILLDLNYTLVGNSTTKRSPFIKQIEIETYRDWLIDLIKPYHVIMLTARPDKYYQDTLDSIKEKTDWQPKQSYFNEYNMPPPAAKYRMLKDYVFPEHGEDPAQYLALESNPKTRSMYAGFNIKAVRVDPEEIWTTLPIE